MARFDFNQLLGKQQEIAGQAREFVDKAVESGRSYIEVTRSSIETEAQDILGKVRAAGATAQGRVQSELGKQLEQIQKIEKSLVSRAEELLGQYGPELEKRVPAASNAVKLASNLLKSVDEQTSKLVESASDAVWSLPIDGYDEMNVATAVKSVKGLSLGELETVRNYEAANKNRKGVIKEIDALLSA